MEAATEERLRPGRAGVDAAALRLFGEHGVAGTSLQMIADSLGVAKSAVYYHYRSKDELVLGVLSPLLNELPAIIEGAEARRGRLARADALLVGLVDLILKQGRRYTVMAGDPSVREALAGLDWLRDWWQRSVDLLAGPDPDPSTRVAVSMLFSSLSAAPDDPSLIDVNRDAICQGMLDGARRLLQIPRRTPSTGA